MLKLLFIGHVLGPALFFFSIAYLLRKPHDWTGPAVMIPLSLALTIFTHFWGWKKIKAAEDKEWRWTLQAAQIGGLISGFSIGVVIYFIIML